MESRLSPLQKDVLDGFFRRQQSFFLTGGAALAGYHLGHRDTEDLDLFTRSADMAEAVSWLRRTVDDLGAEMEPLRTSPDHRRFLVRTADEGVVVDLVYDHTLPGEEPLRHGIVLVDTPAEILANKLCALLSRAEIRDLVDVMALEQAGEDLNAALALAMRKDAGLTPAQLAWVLSEMRMGEDASIPGSVPVAELRSYLLALQNRLAHWAFPKD